MRSIGSLDIYDVRCIGYFGAGDLTPLVDFYLPLIGSDGLAIYLTFQKDPSVKKDSLVTTHECLLKKLGITPIEFSRAMSVLEAVGLIQTYVKESSSGNYYCYCLFSPLSPKDFMENANFKAELCKLIGQEEVERLIHKYAMGVLPKGYKNISSSFESLYGKQENVPNFKNDDSLKGRIVVDALSVSDKKTLDSSLKDAQIAQSAISEQEKKEIARLFRKSGIDLSHAGSFLLSSFQGYRPLGERVDFKQLKTDLENSASLSYLHFKKEGPTSEVDGEGELADIVRDYENLSPIEFLTKKNDAKPIISEKRLLSFLSVELGLTDPVINALIDYVLKNKDNQLPKAYIETIGASLKRSKAKTALDALNYFEKVSAGKKPVNKVAKEVEKQGTEIKPIEQKIEDEEDFDTLLKRYHEKFGK